MILEEGDDPLGFRNSPEGGAFPELSRKKIMELGVRINAEDHGAGPDAGQDPFEKGAGRATEKKDQGTRCERKAFEKPVGLLVGMDRAFESDGTAVDLYGLGHQGKVQP
jgi:hypothetical protein